MKAGITLGVLVLSISNWCVAGDVDAAPISETQLFPLTAVRLLESPFAAAVKANRTYMIDLDPDRLLAPYLREAGLEPRKPPYPNWESMGLDGHTAGHYLSALSDMIASGNDSDGELGRRLDYMLSELERVQKANGDGYIGGIPGSRALWKAVGSGNVDAVLRKWAPWYTLHKAFAGLRDAYVVADRPKAKELLVAFGNWCVNLTSKLSDEQVQRMLNVEQGGMDEVLADIYTITADKKYLTAAERFIHHAVVDPLELGQDKLTGLHANTQIPKIIGLEEIAALTGDDKLHRGAQFFWDSVTTHRSLAFGGNSVSEHFNDPTNFGGMLQSREGPESCNTYNMLRLTEKLFASKPDPRYADFYERALYNHLLSTIDPDKPGYVYFTPIRPEHYRVYSTPQQSFWCCVGTGMENPGRYGQFIYACSHDDLWVNLFVASEAKVADGISVQQENTFPYEPRTHLTLKVDAPKAFTIHLRHPAWVSEGQLAVRVNGKALNIESKPTSYVDLHREWHDQDKIDVELPMHLSTERLPDGSNWAAVLYGPIVLAAGDGTDNLVGEHANAGRMAHVASGPLVDIGKAPTLTTIEGDLVDHIVPDAKAGPLHFRIMDVVEPKAADGVLLEPFFSLRHQRYQMYFKLLSGEELEKQRKQGKAN